MPLPTLAPTIDSNGITAPDYAAILQSLIESAQSIFGNDVYLAADSQDGQLLSIFAAAINDTNQASIAVFNSFRPSFAQGAGLSSLVKLTGIRRNIASNSQVDLTIGGTVGTVITDGLAGDASGNQWALPASVVIPPAGVLIVTATAVDPGAIQAPVNTITTILTPTLGWQSVTNDTAASPGAPVESDAALRRRQTQSVALPSLTALAGTVGAVEALTGVTAVTAYENDTGVTDANGLPAHSIALVVTGGDANEIAQAIMLKKTPGTYTHGAVAVNVVDSNGITHIIRFFVPIPQPINVRVQIKALNGYTSAIGDEIKASVAAYINALPVGQSVFISRIYLPAQLYGEGNFATFELQSVLIALFPAAPGAADVIVPFDGQPTCIVANIALVVT